MRFTVPRLSTLGFAALFAFSSGNAVSGRLFHDVDSEHWTAKYDRYFEKYSKRYFGPHFEWRWFKAQAIAESGLNETARSWVGAKGLMQIMPATYTEIRGQNPHFQDIDHPRWNIAAGIFYNRYLYRNWNGFPEEDRLFMAFASYNAGLGGIQRAVRRVPDKPVRYWAQVERYAPKETRSYVFRIRTLKLGTEQLEHAPRVRGIAAAYQ